MHTEFSFHLADIRSLAAPQRVCLITRAYSYPNNCIVASQAAPFSLISTQLRLENGIPAISYTTFQLHCLVLASFASLVAPFGGFFASGFKRAFNLKDFGDSIPGHGGMTDRMDCQYVKILGHSRGWS